MAPRTAMLIKRFMSGRRFRRAYQAFGATIQSPATMAIPYTARTTHGTASASPAPSDPMAAVGPSNTAWTANPATVQKMLTATSTSRRPRPPDACPLGFSSHGSARIPVAATAAITASGCAGTRRFIRALRTSKVSPSTATIGDSASLRMAISSAQSIPSIRYDARMLDDGEMAWATGAVDVQEPSVQSGSELMDSLLTWDSNRWVLCVQSRSRWGEARSRGTPPPP